MKLSISYSLDYELYRTKETLRNIEWYREHQYKPHLPGGLHIDNVLGYPEKEILEMVKAEFDDALYVEAKNALIEKAEKYLDAFASRLFGLNLPTQDMYVVTLTRFGTGGSYFLPNTVIMNITGKFGIGPINTVMHEITHLTIEPLIIQYEVGHWEKERLVDLIMTKVGPFTTPITQSIPKEYVAKVDPVFEKYYPNIEAIVGEIGGK